MERAYLSIIVVNIPISTKAGRLPINYEFTPANYRKLLLQRMRLYISGDQVLLGSTESTEPTRNIGAWLNGGVWYTWDDSIGRYAPASVGFTNSVTANGLTRKFGMTLAANPSANRTLTLPDAPGFSDGVSNTDTSYVSASANFISSDVGLSITGTNIPVGTTVASRTNSTTIVLSQATTGTGTGLTFHIGRAATAATTLDAIVPRATMILTGTTPTIDASLSNDFYLQLEGNTTIQPITNMPVGGRIKISLENNGTSYTVTWPSSGADEIKWPASPSHTQPSASAGQKALGIYTIFEFNVGLTPHLWGDPEVSGFSAPADVFPGGTSTVPSSYGTFGPNQPNNPFRNHPLLLP